MLGIVYYLEKYYLYDTIPSLYTVSNQPEINHTNTRECLLFDTIITHITLDLICTQQAIESVQYAVAIKTQKWKCQSGRVGWSA